MPFDTTDPISFAPRGSFKLSLAALAVARKELMDARKAEPGKDYIAIFCWVGSRKARENFGSMREMGPGLVLDLYPRRRVPADAVEPIGDIEVAFEVLPEHYETAKKRTVDVDETLPCWKLVFR